MPGKRNSSVESTDYEAAFAHFQDLNNRIERQTNAVFESANKLTRSSGVKEFDDDLHKGNSPVQEESQKRTLIDPLSKPLSSDQHNSRLLVDLNQQLKIAQSDLESMTFQHKRLEEEKEQQRQELNGLKDTMKRLKSTIHSKSLIQEAQKKEMSQMLERLKTEEQLRRSLQKEVERLSKQSVTLMAEKCKLEEKNDKVRADLLLLKQHKAADHPGNKVPVMLKCIRKQAILIENLTNQISYLESVNNTTKNTDTKSLDRFESISTS